MLSSFWRKISNVKGFNQGHKISLQSFNNLPFKNNFNNLTIMFQTRLWFIENNPYNHINMKYGNQLSHLHKQLNYLQGRLLLKRLSLVIFAIFMYQTFIFEQQARDYRDKFDLKFNQKAYGSLDDSSGEGNTSIDD